MRTGRGIGPYASMAGVFLLFTVLFLYPMVHTVTLSVSEQDGFGPGNYVSFLSGKGGWGIIGLTAFLSGSAALLSAALSVFLLFAMPARGRLRTAAMSTVLLPVVVPGLIFALGLLLLWDETGWLNLALARLGIAGHPLRINYTPHGLIIFYTWLYFPFTTLAVLSRWEAVPKDAVEAARVCGAGRTRILASVILPLLWPGIVTGASMSFMLSFGAFSVPLICGGDHTPLSVEIYRRAVVFGDWETGTAAAVLMAAVQLLILGVFSLRSGEVWKT